MPTRLISWQQIVLENDPDWVRLSLNPVVWEFSNGRRFVDPNPVYGPPGPTNLLNDGGFVVLDGDNSWPTNPSGLAPGCLFSNGGFVTAVAGSSPQPGAAPLFFPGLTSSQLLLFGASALPLTNPTATNQLWLNGGFVCVA